MLLPMCSASCLLGQWLGAAQLALAAALLLQFSPPSHCCPLPYIPCTSLHRRSYGHPGPNPPKHRRAGVILHPTSLPGKYGMGEIGAEAFAFVDWLAASGMQLWQVSCACCVPCASCCCALLLPRPGWDAPLHGTMWGGGGPAAQASVSGAACMLCRCNRCRATP